jgi:hypothetical protein
LPVSPVTVYGFFVDDDLPVVTDPFGERVVEPGCLVVVTKIVYTSFSLLTYSYNRKTNLNIFLV